MSPASLVFHTEEAVIVLTSNHLYTSLSPKENKQLYSPSTISLFIWETRLGKGSLIDLKELYCRIQ